MPDRLPTPPSSSQQDPNQQGPRQTTDADSHAQRAEGADQAREEQVPEDRTPGTDNPFAPPPEGSPDRPWQPRRPEDGAGQEDQSRGRGRWSPRQPGRSSGPFGQRLGGDQEKDNLGGGPGGPGSGLRWDPTDPAQRRARYALLSGMWAFFFALFSWPYVALLLGALAVYWSISALRARPAPADPTATATPPVRTEPEAQAAAKAAQPKPQTTAAVSGLVTACLALAMVAATFTAQIVYRDYYTCVSDALTTTAQKSCEDKLPEQLRPFLSTPAE
ncbi:hypothetical protein ACFQVC_24650 [Streptomyces monticola]|uniref:Integral membrane protein n=1 Tax=Streptomyces monticola TaxID=2666263 RepID=A0ABW2JMM5_9ACTN